ncbi:MAG: glutamate 5-kinase [Senegalimassilia faecalis]
MSETDAQGSRARRLVIKIGSSTLTTSESSIDYGYLRKLADQVARVRDAGWQPVIVTSAAIACGLEALGIHRRPTDMPSLQAAASVGQSALSTAYAEVFARHGIVTSTVLLTRRDTADRQAYLHARNTLLRLLDLGVVPIINENDTVAVEQIKFGDNDTLAALAACLIDADLLVILSDIDGLYDANPNTNPQAKLIEHVDKIGPEILAVAGGAGSTVGSGGMIDEDQGGARAYGGGHPAHHLLWPSGQRGGGRGGRQAGGHALLREGAPARDHAAQAVDRARRFGARRRGGRRRGESRAYRARKLAAVRGSFRR